MLCFFAVKIVGILMAVFAKNYTIFVIGRFLIGGGQVGYFLPGFVLGNVTIQYTISYNIIQKYNFYLFIYLHQTTRVHNTATTRTHANTP